MYPAVRQHAKPTNKAWCLQQASGVRRTAVTIANSVQRTERNETVTRELHVGSVIAAGHRSLMLCPCVSLLIVTNTKINGYIYTALRAVVTVNNVQKVDSSWNVMAHGEAREGKWRENWRMEWVASTLHTTWKHGVSSITTADAHISAASSRLNWRPRRFKWTRPFRRKRNLVFARVPSHFNWPLPEQKWHTFYHSRLSELSPSSQHTLRSMTQCFDNYLFPSSDEATLTSSQINQT